MSPAPSVTPLRRVPDEAILIRAAHPEDVAAVRRLAALDSAPAPAGRLLLAEVDGALRAVLALDLGTAIADPFFPTVHLVAMLRARAEALPAPARPAARRTGRPGAPALRPA
jgi:hypothetical protein